MAALARRVPAEPGHIAAQAARNEQVVGIFHAREIVQAHLVERAARDRAVDVEDAAALRAHARRQGLRGGPVLVRPGGLVHRPVGHGEGPVEGGGLGAASRLAVHIEMSVRRGPSQRFAPFETEPHERVDRSGMKPMGTQIHRMALEEPRDGAPADPVPRLQDRHRETGGDETSRRTDAGAACADDHHVGFPVGLLEDVDGGQAIGRHGLLHPSRSERFVHK